MGENRKHQPAIRLSAAFAITGRALPVLCPTLAQRGEKFKVWITVYCK
jgi:hypothetical protein